MLTTRFTELVGCSIPIQQAGMGALAPPELAAAVSEAGGLGMIGTARPGGHSIRGLSALLARTTALTSRPFGVNFIVSPLGLTQLDPNCFALAARAAKVVEFFYGWPDPALVEVVHRNGALAFWQIGSREEAVAAEQAGADIVVAQGVGAGGHVRGTIGLLALLDEVLEAVNVPILAAGGIGSGRTLAAVLAAGASGARVGTRLAASAESTIHPAYLERLIAARAIDTLFTEAYSNNWPHAPHRVLRSCIEAAEAFTGEVVGETPSLDGSREVVTRWDCLAINQGTTGAIEAMPHWAGESVGAVTRVQPAAEIVSELSGEAERLLRQWSTIHEPDQVDEAPVRT
jgi:NAD(P)H-dependent flavin oxidoreductase YrpB (nitropropane dioxygenase family)